MAAQPGLTTPPSISSLLAQFGEVDESSVVLSLKPPKKAPTKPPKNGTALVPFKQIGDAFAAVCASGRADRGLEGVEISWAEGKEPPILGWLKRQGKLDSVPKPQSISRSECGNGAIGAKDRTKELFESLCEKPATSPFSSFPDSFVSYLLVSSIIAVYLTCNIPQPSAPDFQPANPAEPPGLDYESLTLMRLRQAERAKLEQEIRDAEVAEAP